MKTKWQPIVDDLLTVFKTGKALTAAVNRELGGESTITETVISRIKNGETTRMFYESGQALMILHARYVPLKRKNNNNSNNEGMDE